MSKLSKIFYFLAALSSNIMCAVVAYSYCDMQWAIKYEGASAPAETVFIYAAPFLFFILFCVVIAWIANNSHSNNTKL